MKGFQAGILISFVGLMSSCSEFLEQSIANRQVNILAPAQNLETSSYKQSFWWEGVSDALFYRLQIVSPRFDSVSNVVIDTLLKTNKFTYTLDPGKYQWRVKAENGSSATAFATRSLTIYPSSITEQSIQLTAPVSGLITNKPELNYSWLSLFGATSYRLQVDNNNFLDETNLLQNIVTENLSYLQQMQTEGKLQYRVRAENATETSKWSTVGNVSYDITPPAQVSLTSPANRQQLTLPSRLSWEALADADRYQLYVYTADSTTLYSAAFPVTLSANSHLLESISSQQSLVWRVRAIDKAGNIGAYSSYRTFSIQ